jgi:hypothetical protein
MFLLGKELAPLVGPHNPFCVFDHGGPVKPLSKGFSYQSIWRCMAATSPRVNVSQEFYPIFYGYASLQDSTRAFMMYFVIPHNVRFGSLTYPIGFILIDEEDTVS